MADDILSVSIRRSDPGAPSTFEVARTMPMTVLDVLLAVQHGHDASLAFRYSCRIAACGTCTVELDGRPVLACQAGVPEGRSEVRLGPIGGLPVVRDLVVDMSPFFAAWREVLPSLIPVGGLDEPAIIPPASPERSEIDPDRGCITCGACFSTCAMSGGGSEFLGPAALTRAMVLLADSRDAAGSDRLRRVSGPDGVDGCHYHGGCTVVCPKGLDPARAIRRIRRRRLRRS